MEGSLVGSSAASLCATTAAGRRRAARSGARFSSCSCSSRDELVTRAWASYSCVSRMPREVTSVARINGWNGNGHRWTAALEDSSVLEAGEDEYGGMVVDADRLPSDTAAFVRSLSVSLSYWKLAGKKGVWLKLPLDRSEYIPLAVKEGFRTDITTQRSRI